MKVIQCQSWQDYYDRCSQSVLARMVHATADGEVPVSDEILQPPIEIKNSEDTAITINFPFGLFELSYQDDLCISLLMCFEQIISVGIYFSLLEDKFKGLQNSSAIEEADHVKQLTAELSFIITFCTQQFFCLQNAKHPALANIPDAAKQLFYIKQAYIEGQAILDLPFGQVYSTMNKVMEYLKQSSNNLMYLADLIKPYQITTNITLSPSALYRQLQSLIYVIYTQASEFSLRHPALQIPVVPAQLTDQFSKYQFNLPVSSAILDLFVWYDTPLETADTVLSQLANCIIGRGNEAATHISNNFKNTWYGIKRYIMWRKSEDVVCLSRIMTCMTAVKYCLSLIAAAAPEKLDIPSAPLWFHSATITFLVVESLLIQCETLAHCNVNVKDTTYLGAVKNAKLLFFPELSLKQLFYAAEQVNQQCESIREVTGETSLKVCSFKLKSTKML